MLGDEIRAVADEHKDDGYCNVDVNKLDDWADRAIALDAQITEQAETIKDAHKRHGELATKYHDLKERCDKVGCWRKT